MCTLELKRCAIDEPRTCRDLLSFDLGICHFKLKLPCPLMETVFRRNHLEDEGNLVIRNLAVGFRFSNICNARGGRILLTLVHQLMLLLTNNSDFPFDLTLFYCCPLGLIKRCTCFIFLT